MATSPRGQVNELVTYWIRLGDTFTANGLKQRVHILPDYPAMADTVPGYAWSQWVGYFAPAKTPPAIVNKLSAEIARAAKLPDLIQKLEQGKVVVGSSPEELRRLLAREVPAWKKVAEETGATLDD